MCVIRPRGDRPCVIFNFDKTRQTCGRVYRFLGIARIPGNCKTNVCDVRMQRFGLSDLGRKNPWGCVRGRASNCERGVQKCRRKSASLFYANGTCFRVWKQISKRLSSTNRACSIVFNRETSPPSSCFDKTDFVSGMKRPLSAPPLCFNTVSRSSFRPFRRRSYVSVSFPVEWFPIFDVLLLYIENSWTTRILLSVLFTL